MHWSPSFRRTCDGEWQSRSIRNFGELPSRSRHGGEELLHGSSSKVFGEQRLLQDCRLLFAGIHNGGSSWTSGMVLPVHVCATFRSTTQQSSPEDHYHIYRATGAQHALSLVSLTARTILQQSGPWPARLVPSFHCTIPLSFNGPKYQHSCPLQEHPGLGHRPTRPTTLSP